MENLHFTPEDFADYASSYISKEFLSTVANFEGFRESAYKCPSGVSTIGFGHTSRICTEKYGLKVTLDIAKATLHEDLLNVFSSITSIFPSFPLLPECYRNMLIDLGFNCGTSNFSKNYTELHCYVAKFIAIFSKKHNVLSSTCDNLLLIVLRYSYSDGRFLTGLQRRRYHYVKHCILWHEKNGYLK